MPSGFKGQYNHNIDAKGRLIIPNKLRGDLGDSFVLTRGLDGCLYGFPNDEWKIFEDNLRKISGASGDGRKVKEYFMANAQDMEFDSQGRIIIPPHLRNFAKLTKEVAIVGNLEKIEIWDAAIWTSRQTSIEENVEDILENMSGLGAAFF